MLKHCVIGPRKDGSFAAGYQTPGCSSMTVACDCSTLEQAQEAVDRLNLAQVAGEKNNRSDRVLRGLRGTYPDLKGRK